MAIILHKNSSFKICDENSYEHELKNGWFLSKAEAKAEMRKTETKKTELKVPAKKFSHKG